MTARAHHADEKDRATLFPLGECLATPETIRALTDEGGDWLMNVAVYLARHQDGD